MKKYILVMILSLLSLNSIAQTNYISVNIDQLTNGIPSGHLNDLFIPIPMDLSTGICSNRVYYWTTNGYTFIENTPDVVAYFTKTDKCATKIVDILNGATNSIYIQAYVLSSSPILIAITNAQARGVNVEIILDKKMWEVSSSWWLINNNIRVMSDSKHAISHNKIMIIDNKIVVTGSYNFTFNAEHRNAENVIIIKNNQKIIDEFMQNYLMHQSHSQLWTNGIPTNAIIRTVK